MNDYDEQDDLRKKLDEALLANDILTKDIEHIENEMQELTHITKDFHWMARRYADGRISYATSLFNDHVRALLKMGIDLKSTGVKESIWAKDGMGRVFDGLTDEEAKEQFDAN